jgi:myo-inositol-1(or 4)-monophosphatase
MEQVRSISEVFSDIQPVIDVAYAAGELLLSKWPGNVEAALEIEKKKDGSFVTEADYASNELIVSTLRQLFPRDGIISEEIPRDPDVTGMECVWIIDPLDGTQSFIDGKDDFSILIARVENQRVTHSVMFFPAMQEMALAKVGAGAFINGERIFVSSSTQLRTSSVYIRNFAPSRTECVYPDHMDSGMAFLALARGVIDGVIMRMGRHQEWDLAAPSLLIAEAGGVVSTEHQDEVTYNHPSIPYKYFVASNQRTHAELARLIPDN